jgi:hypothetical protein
MLERRSMVRATTRRDFLKISGSALAGGLLTGNAPMKVGATGKGPHDYIIVEGHRDIWELSDRFKLNDPSQRSPMRDFLVPRLIEGGVSIVIMPAGGDSIEERDGRDVLFEGSMRVLDMLLVEIEKTNGKASLIKTTSDIPTRPNKGRVQIFIDLEGGGAIQIDPEPGYHPDRRLCPRIQRGAAIHRRGSPEHGGTLEHVCSTVG